MFFEPLSWVFFNKWRHVPGDCWKPAARQKWLCWHCSAILWGCWSWERKRRHPPAVLPPTGIPEFTSWAPLPVINTGNNSAGHSHHQFTLGYSTARLTGGRRDEFQIPVQGVHCETPGTGTQPCRPSMAAGATPPCESEWQGVSSLP